MLSICSIIEQNVSRAHRACLVCGIWPSLVRLTCAGHDSKLQIDYHDLPAGSRSESKDRGGAATGQMQERQDEVLMSNFIFAPVKPTDYKVMSGSTSRLRHLFCTMICCVSYTGGNSREVLTHD